MQLKPKILVVCDFYLPGFESGGAPRTLANMIERLGDRYEFRVITRDRDGVAADKPYETVDIGAWNRIGKALVYYLPPNQVRIWKISELIKTEDPDVIYVNSFFSPLTIMCLAITCARRVREIPLILAPEGEFSAGAIALRKFKKLPYLALFRALRLSPKIIWKAASNAELADIQSRVGTVEAVVAPNMPPPVVYPEFDPQRRPMKSPGECRMIFLSRFARKKNFNWLIPLLGRVPGQIEVDIVGTVEEAEYWAECQHLAANLPERIQINAIGPVVHEQVQQKLAEYDFFILPTLGENFGHVFIEAFASGVPVITSDRTPWRGLEELGIGWDLPLERPDDWVAAMSKAVGMPGNEHREMCHRAREFALRWLADPDIERSNVAVLEKALASRC